MNSFSFTLPGKQFTCPSILIDSIAGQTNLGCRSLLFITLNTSYQSLLAYKVSFERSVDTLSGTPWQITLCFSLAAFKILSLSSIFGTLIMMFHDVFLFGSNLFGTLCASRTCMSSSFAKLGKFSFIIFSNKFSISCSSSSPSGSLMIQMVVRLKLSQQFLSLSSFYGILFSSCYFDYMLFPSLCSKSLV